MNQDLTGKVALVTGASRGIGAAIAKTLAEHGAKVIGTGITESAAAAIGETLKIFGGEGCVLNIEEENSIENVVADIEKAHGRIDILVNNAGITRDNLLMRMKESEWDEIMQINLKSVFRASKAVVRGMMKARAGRIISIASVVGVMGNAGQTNYAAAKAGLIGFSKSMAREVGSRGITVNCVAPGFIDTAMTRALPQEQRDVFTAQTALGYFGTPEDVADAVLFLASDQARYITGQTLHVNGGMLMP
ncbi:3-oxoacyl-ACP reductase FabG [Stenoxybacter acetivorans]|uniref:3-oxoacyl-ACP reductase FabG n=1 Tax=Stenoxybacter acetivorans TaxID=422441 RepID=UPI00056D4A6A|nr:3-oxoacyl-ACP reductase FabG [Stenoxybacter acetivorans]